jgi:hypothetical protein
MIHVAIPTGRPGNAPRGPAGPHPEPNRPGTPTRPAEPPKPSAPSKGSLLRLIDDSLIGALAAATTSLPDPADQVEAAGQAILAFRLRRARAAVADLLKYSGRDGKDIAAAVASRPVQPPAGRPPLPGGDFLLPRDVRMADAIGRP